MASGLFLLYLSQLSLPKGARMKALVIIALWASASAAQTPLESGIQLFDTGKFAEAEQFFSDVVKREPTNHAAMYYLARSIGERDGARLQRMEESKNWAEKAVQLQPNNSDYHLWYGRALGVIALNGSKLKMLSRAGKIKHEFETAVQLDPSNVDARIALMEYYLNAPGIAGGSKTKAMQQAEAARRLDAYRGGLAVARVYSGSSNWTAAEQEVRALGNSYPDSADVGIDLLLLFQTTKQYDRAFATVDSLQRVTPNEPSWLYQIGRIASVSGQQLERGEQALQSYLKVPEARHRTAHAVAHYRLGLIYEKRGQKELAKQEFQAALADQPRHSEARKGLARVD
jgi:tetratricopeptide (TPR) repeat protein